MRRSPDYNMYAKAGLAPEEPKPEDAAILEFESALADLRIEFEAIGRASVEAEKKSENALYQRLEKLRQGITEKRNKRIAKDKKKGIRTDEEMLFEYQEKLRYLQDRIDRAMRRKAK